MDVHSPGAYVHVPFCAQRCGYCDFNVLVGASDELIAAYPRAVLAELAAVAAAGPDAVAPASSGSGWPTFGSLFVGGGTPTLLPAQVLADLLRSTLRALPFGPDAEVTVETNPESVDASSLRALVDAGLTRLSIGAQSTAAHVLRFLDRLHDPQASLRTVEAARRAGVPRVNVDLIYGAPAETSQDWRASLEATVDAGVDHVSCYALTLEPNTPYARQVRLGAKPAPDDDVAAARMAVADELLQAAGFRRYEISNWARPGSESRHNRTYWRAGDYLGLGAGAHGHWQGRRWWNVRSTHRYVERALAGTAPVAGEEVLDDGARRVERLMLGLRTADGVAVGDVEPLDEVELRRCADEGLIVHTAGRLALTAVGRPLADAVTLRLLPG